MPAATFGLLGAGVAVGFEDRDGNLSGIALTTAGTPERVDHVEHVGPVDDATETDVPVGVVTDSGTAAQPRRSPSRSSAARTPRSFGVATYGSPHLEQDWRPATARSPR